MPQALLWVASAFPPWASDPPSLPRPPARSSYFLFLKQGRAPACHRAFAGAAVSAWNCLLNLSVIRNTPSPVASQSQALLSSWHVSSKNSSFTCLPVELYLLITQVSQTMKLKRRLLLRKKVMTNLDSILKSRNIS